MAHGVCASMLGESRPCGALPSLCWLTAPWASRRWLALMVSWGHREDRDVYECFANKDSRNQDDAMFLFKKGSDNQNFYSGLTPEDSINFSLYVFPFRLLRGQDFM